jgi:ribose 5-phosphate isomerase A
MNPKQRAAAAAIEHVRSNTTIGLGSGSTADLFLDVLADALRSGQLQNVVGVPTSEQTRRRCGELKIPLTTLTAGAPLDVTIDGADDIAPNLDLIKGLGAAALREKMVAQHSKRLIIIADASKPVQKLGTKSPLPVEVVQFEHEASAKFLRSLGCEVKLREKTDGSPYVTDNGNYIYHCKFPNGIDDPPALDRTLKDRAGIVESGLFLGLAKLAIIADNTGIRTISA